MDLKQVSLVFTHKFIVILLGLVLAACGNNNSKAGWGSFPVPLYTDDSIARNTEALSDLSDAMKFWEDRAGKKLFDYKGTTRSSDAYSGSTTSPSRIEKNIIFIPNQWPLDFSIVGQTIVNSSATTSQIQSAMVLINGYASFCYGDCINQDGYATSARKTFTHELGHFIGLNHNPNDTNDIMYPQIMYGGQLDTVRINTEALKAVTQE